MPVDKVTKIIDIKDFGFVGSDADARRAKEEAKDFIVEQLLSDIGSSKSSVSGRGFKRKKDGKTSNLEDKGDLLDSLEVRDVDGEVSQLEVGWFDPSQVPKADGHNNHSGDSKLPTRKSIPKDDENFRPSIRKELEKIADEYSTDLEARRQRAAARRLIEEQGEATFSIDRLLGDSFIDELLNEFAIGS